MQRTWIPQPLALVAAAAALGLPPAPMVARQAGGGTPVDAEARPSKKKGSGQEGQP
jgi:adenine/guanine phosphoribosyltransferase-like PRPP-binding protein